MCDLVSQFLLGVDRDHRLLIVDERLRHVVQIVELGVAVGALASLVTLALACKE